MELFKALTSRLNFYDKPFSHWDYSKPLTEEAIKEICNADFGNLSGKNFEYDGTRAIDGGEGKYREGIKSGGKARKYRLYITKENSHVFPELKKFIDELCSKNVCQHISKLVKKDLSNSFVRLEIICDREGFWLKPHCDIKEKLVSGLIFANPFNESENLGTDLYDETLNKIKTIPYKDNYGYFFTSGLNTWHGMEKKKIKKERRGLQVNYVTFKTDWKVKS